MLNKITKMALAGTLILATASAALASNGSKAANTGNAGIASGHARGSYAQAYVRPSPNGTPNPSTEPTSAQQPLTPFEQDWFHFQRETPE